MANLCSITAVLAAVGWQMPRVRVVVADKAMGVPETHPTEPAVEQAQWLQDWVLQPNKWLVKQQVMTAMLGATMERTAMAPTSWNRAPLWLMPRPNTEVMGNGGWETHPTQPAGGGMEAFKYRRGDQSGNRRGEWITQLSKQSVRWRKGAREEEDKSGAWNEAGEETLASDLSTQREKGDGEEEMELG